MNEPICHEFNDGIRLVYLNKLSEVGHLGFFFRAGSRFEKKNKVGLAHFLEHCVFKGTHKRNAIQTISRIDEVGGELNAYTAKEELCLHASFPKKYTSRAIELLSDIALNPVFPSDELNKEKEIILDEINSYLDSPYEKIFDDFEEEMFKGHALGNNILGKKEGLNEFTKADLQEYVKSYFTKDNLVVSYVGEVPFKKVVQYLEKYLINMPESSSSNSFEVFKNYKSFDIYRKEANYQAHAIIGGMAPGYKDENRIAMTLLMNILGGPAMNSSLNLLLREKHVLAYGVEANYVPYADVGFWQIYVGSESKNLKKSIKLIKRELKKMQKSNITDVRLKKAKQQLKGQMALSMDSNSGLMHSLGKSFLAFGQIDTIQEIHKSIDDISSSQLKKLANTFMDDSQISTLVFDLR
ncbi:MAG: M16 family metallopeptidase [Crocinitomicaceae bacterium]